MPPELTARLNREINLILKRPDVIKKMGDMGVLLTETTPEQFGQILTRDADKRAGGRAGLRHRRCGGRLASHRRPRPHRARPRAVHRQPLRRRRHARRAPVQLESAGLSARRQQGQERHAPGPPRPA
ncbi:hypothetical protein G6F57_018907 [Rhizopus arrhizus]|nr:hypothetical protein G6F57_018907 [Rhizopus arrhizus]